MFAKPIVLQQHDVSMGYCISIVKLNFKTFVCSAELLKGFLISVLYCRFNPVNLLSADCIKGWHICQLEVMECRKIPWPAIVVQDEYCVEDCGWPSQDYAYECKINLLTGRTHQVCQLSFYVLFEFYFLVDS